MQHDSWNTSAHRAWWVHYIYVMNTKQTELLVFIRYLKILFMSSFTMGCGIGIGYSSPCYLQEKGPARFYVVFSVTGSRDLQPTNVKFSMRLIWGQNPYHKSHKTGWYSSNIKLDCITGGYKPCCSTKSLNDMNFCYPFLFTQHWKIVFLLLLLMA